jgi:hypothetical protein
MTQPENELREYIRLNLIGDSMGSVELLLLKELGIPVLLEVARRRNADKDVKDAIKDIQDDPKKAIEKITPKVKGGIINALADILDPLIGGLFNDKTSSV